MGFLRGPDRTQTFLFPPSIDGMVAQDSPVRFIDTFVDSLDLVALGFASTIPAETGRPGYYAGDLLKGYIYGYVVNVRSSRRLEAEMIRNLDMIWLVCSIRPDFKTIADFRSKNKEAFEKVFEQFLLVCYSAGLVAGEESTVDGSKFKAVNSPERYLHSETIEKQLAVCKEKVVKYVAHMDEMDAIEAKASQDSPGSKMVEALEKANRLSRERLKEHVEFWEQRQRVLKEQEKHLDELVAKREAATPGSTTPGSTTPGSTTPPFNSPEDIGETTPGETTPATDSLQKAKDSNKAVKEAGLTDPDCVRLGDRRKGTKVGYNVQIAVDNKHDLILVADVTRDKNDRGQLFSMAKKTSDILKTLQQTVGLVELADEAKSTEPTATHAGMSHPEASHAEASLSAQESPAAPENPDAQSSESQMSSDSPVVASQVDPSGPQLSSPPGVGLTILADAGYHSVTQLEACEENGLIAFVPNQGSSSGRSTNGVKVFAKEMFQYQPAKDDAGEHYVCPAGEILPITAAYKDPEQKVRLTFSNAKACCECPLKAHCTQSVFRKISRMQNDAVTERTAARVKANPEKVRQRKNEIEHVFGTLKNNGHDIFLMRGIAKVSAELHLSTLAYNLKCSINHIGVPKLIEAVGRITHVLRPPLEETSGKKSNLKQLGAVGAL